MRRSLFLGVAIITVSAAGVTAAVGRSGTQTTQLSRASLTGDATSVDFLRDRETQVVKLTLEPGGTSGWHRHPVQGMFLVDQGTMTNYGLDGPPCDPVEIGAGQAQFFGPHAHHAHLLRNTGEERLEVTVLYFNLAPGQRGAEGATRPAECPADLN